MLRNTQSQQVPHLELCILTSRVGLYSEPPAEIMDDRGAQSAMMTIVKRPKRRQVKVEEILSGLRSIIPDNISSTSPTFF